MIEYLREHRSPNHGDELTPTLIVVHGSRGTDDGDEAHILADASDVSYHVLARRDGGLVRLVPDDLVAWHAGRSTWNGRDHCNEFALGLGLSHKPGERWQPEKLEAGAQQIAWWMLEHDIPFAGVVGHYHVSPGRKSDPWDLPWGDLLGRVVSYYMAWGGDA